MNVNLLSVMFAAVEIETFIEKMNNIDQVFRASTSQTF